ncbi:MULTISPECIES: type III secretion system translocon subunit SctE [Burkholderia]|nr:MULTISPECIES: type III secretion system translocon subunit SctE [Burkholderia]AGK46907.1 secretion system effector C (SseC) like family protein [Burkholderia thailandensis MSMB121]KST74348.1 secretion protein [Burkholderia humptydooensis]KVN03466.1 secretion protein [Burkholderia sp. MSMB1552]KWZ55898.1 secretion protein [Burkholderia sp. MSMB1588]
MTVSLSMTGPQGSVPIASREPAEQAERARAATQAMLGGVSVIVDDVRARLPDATGIACRALVSLKDAAQALGRIIDKFDSATAPGAKHGAADLRDFGNVSMDSMLLATTLLSSKVLGNTAELKTKALSIMSAKQEEVRRQEVQEYREQIDKAIEQQQKAKKAGIFGVIFDWIVAAVEVVSGVAKIVGGALTGNVTTVAGGAMDLMAGFAGVIKATMNTLALIDKNNAEKYHAVADVAAKVQLAFEIAGAVVDITSAARNMLLTKAIPKATTAVLQQGAEQALVSAIKAGSKDAIKSTAQAVGKEVAAQVSDQILQGIGKAALEASKKAGKDAAQKAVQQLGVNRMLESFSREAIEKMVAKSVEKVASKAIEEGIEMSAKELTKAITREVNKEVMSAALRASTSVLLNATRASVGAAQQVTAGVLAVERAKLQKEIDQLILDQQWLQMCFEFYAQQKEAQTKQVKDLIEKSGEIIADGSKTLKQTATVQAQIAASMV